MMSVCSSVRNQVTVLGINSLFGRVVSFLLKQSPVTNRLVLYDEVGTGVAQDIAEIPTPCKIVVYNGEDQLRCAVKNSDVILIGDKDDCLANDDEAISRKAEYIVRCAHAISSVAPNAIVLIAATPVNSLLPLFTEAQIGSGTFNCDKVMGVTSADTMRASTLLARHMGIDPEKAYLPVIGGYSADTRIPLFSQSRPTINATKNELKNLTRVVKTTEDELKSMLNRGEALNKAYATVQLIDSVMSALRGQRNISEIVLSRTCLVPNVDYFSLPVILGPRGIAHRFPLPSLTERESILLDHAVKHIEIDKMKGINALSGECSIPEAPRMTEKYSELVNCCPNDLVGSLMEKFKLGSDCPEICEPRVEYKLLSKVKLKLPAESTPSEIPKRTKFIEPDTPPQDGCCPLRLPCPPIPPIRGLNQIQAKHTCKTKDKRKACKCFFPPVEKSLVPCKLCPSNKGPCVDYGDFKTFFEEHRHCCEPISCALERQQCSEVALVSTSHNSSSAVVIQEPSFVQLASPNEPNPPPMLNSPRTKVLSIAPSEPVMTASEQPKMISYPVMDYPRAEVCPQPEVNPTANLQHQSNQNVMVQVNSTEKPSSLPTIYERNQQIASNPEKFGSQSSVEAANPMSIAQQSKTNTNQINQQDTARTKNPIVQHEDPNWPFKCSTSLCLDILAPKLAGYQSAQGKHAETPISPTSEATCPQKHSELQNSDNTNANTNLQHPSTTSPEGQNRESQNQQEPKKKYNYSSGLSLTNPQDVVNMPAMNENLNGSNSQESSRHSLTSKIWESFQISRQPGSHSLPSMLNDGSNDQMDNNLSKLNVSGKVPNTVSSEINNQKERAATDGSSNLQENSVNKREPTESRKFNKYDVHARDENVKRRLYATLKVIEDALSESQPTTSTTTYTTSASFGQYLNAERYSSNKSEESPKTERNPDNMISILRESAKSINANMELQRDLRARTERIQRRKRGDNIRLGDLIDTINPAKRLPRRLEGRPALRKVYSGLQNIYDDPRRFSRQGKRASILATPTAGHEERSLVAVENPGESKKLATRVEKIKERIQQALKKIIYPAKPPSDFDVAEKVSKHQQRLESNKFVTRQAMRKSKAKQDFFTEMRTTDPAYRPTTKMYAPKCPTSLLFNNHPENQKMITFNNVAEYETTRNSNEMRNLSKSALEKRSFTAGNSSQRETNRRDTSFIFPNVPDFPALILRDMEFWGLERMKEDLKGQTLYPQGNSMPHGAEPTAAQQPADEPKWFKYEIGENQAQGLNRNLRKPSVPIRGDYVKHFVTSKLPKATLPESVKALIRERTRNATTTGSPVVAQKRNEMRYGMTSPNRITRTRRQY